MFLDEHCSRYIDTLKFIKKIFLMFFSYRFSSYDDDRQNQQINVILSALQAILSSKYLVFILLCSSLFHFRSNLFREWCTPFTRFIHYAGLNSVLYALEIFDFVANLQDSKYEQLYNFLSIYAHLQFILSAKIIIVQHVIILILVCL